MDKTHQFNLGNTFQCGDYTLRIISIDHDHDVIGYLITSPGREDRTDARYRDRFIEALAEYGH